jgi:hypothetical protein
MRQIAHVSVSKSQDQTATAFHFFKVNIFDSLAFSLTMANFERKQKKKINSVFRAQPRKFCAKILVLNLDLFNDDAAI